MDSDLRLPKAHRRDMTRMSIAAMVSTAFFITPLVLRDVTEAPRATEALVSPSVTVVTTDVVLPETVMAFEPLAIPAPTPPRSTASPQRVRPVHIARTTARPDTDRDKADKKISQRLARLIAGDGRYTVRPFPTVGSER